MNIQKLFKEFLKDQNANLKYKVLAKEMPERPEDFIVAAFAWPTYDFNYWQALDIAWQVELEKVWILPLTGLENITYFGKHHLPTYIIHVVEGKLPSKEAMYFIDACFSDRTPKGEEK